MLNRLHTTTVLFERLICVHRNIEIPTLLLTRSFITLLTTTVNYIKVKRLAWARHLVRMNNDRTLKKIFNTKPDGARSVGRPKLRWKDGVDQDMRILGVKN